MRCVLLKGEAPESMKTQGQLVRPILVALLVVALLVAALPVAALLVVVLLVVVLLVVVLLVTVLLVVVLPAVVLPAVAGVVPLAVEVGVAKYLAPQNMPLEAVVAERLPAAGAEAVPPEAAGVAALGSTHSSIGGSSTTSDTGHRAAADSIPHMLEVEPKNYTAGSWKTLRRTQAHPSPG
jgi:hypothetical protein